MTAAGDCFPLAALGVATPAADCFVAALLAMTDAFGEGALTGAVTDATLGAVEDVS